MAFQIKDFTSIVASEINHARSATLKITDYLPGSVARTLMEAPAVEIEELYLQMFLGLREAIPVSTFISFGFTQLSAAYAAGIVSVSAPTPLVSDINIPTGTEFSAADGRRYAASADVVWPSGSSMIEVPVRALVLGSSGNISAGSINASSLFGSSYTISNQALSTGRDVETFAEREIRFAEFVQSLSRGTLIAVRYAARQAAVVDSAGATLEYVTRIGVDEQAGRVYIYLYSSIGAPSASLLANGQLMVDGGRDEATVVTTSGYRAAGVRVDVLSMPERAVPLSVEVAMQSGYTLTSAVRQSLSDIFSAQVRAVEPGETLYLGSMVEALLSVPGIQSVVPVTGDNFVCEVYEVLVPGTMVVTAL